MSRQISDAGLALIKAAEGLMLEAYRDSVGIWTIGYGSTRNVHEGDEITVEEATERLRQDLSGAEDCVEQAAPGLSDQQFAACVSFVFNLGCGAFQGSTLLKRIHAQDWLGAAEEFLRWDHAGGRQLPGLTARRKAEMAMFLKGSP